MLQKVKEMEVILCELSLFKPVVLVVWLVDIRLRSELQRTEVPLICSNCNEITVVEEKRFDPYIRDLILYWDPNVAPSKVCFSESLILMHYRKTAVPSLLFLAYGKVIAMDDKNPHRDKSQGNNTDM